MLRSGSIAYSLCRLCMLNRKILQNPSLFPISQPPASQNPDPQAADRHIISAASGIRRIPRLAALLCIEQRYRRSRGVKHPPSCMTLPGKERPSRLMRQQKMRLQSEAGEAVGHICKRWPCSNCFGLERKQEGSEAGGKGNTVLLGLRQRTAGLVRTMATLYERHWRPARYGTAAQL